jgi:V/A-type H+-transporting ATPase subunit C
MISSVLKYSYPNTKVRAMKGELLSPSEFLSLLNAESYQEFLHIVNTTNYAAALSEKDFEEISLPILTNILYRSLFIDYEKVIRSVKGEMQKFFILLYQKYEVINLKTILRGICSEIASEQVAPLLLPTERYTLFSKEKLLEFREVHDVIEHLQGTFFQYPLNRALHRFEKEREFFPLEMALDLHYYHTLWDNVTKLPGEENTIVRELLGMVIDVLNIAWIVRFKEQYQFSPEEILNYTIHHGYIFRLRDRRILAGTRGAREILAYLKETPFGKVISGDEPLNTLHVVLTRHVVTQLQKYFSRQPFQIGVILGYLFLKEFEISDLITIAEAKKYGFSLEQSKEYVINA